MLNPYRSHTCGELRLQNVNETVRLSGWIHRKRDHGQLLFIDLRDHYGITQCVIDSETPYFKEAENVVLQAQQSGLSAWSNQVGVQNRFQLIDNLLSPNMKQFRSIFYSYHTN